MKVVDTSEEMGKNYLTQQTNLLVNYLFLNPSIFRAPTLAVKSLLKSKTIDLPIDIIGAAISFLSVREVFTILPRISKQWSYYLKKPSVLNINWIKPGIRLHPQLILDNSIATLLLSNSNLNQLEIFIKNKFDLQCGWKDLVKRFSLLKTNLSEFRYPFIISCHEEIPSKFYSSLTSAELVKLGFELLKESIYFKNMHLNEMPISDTIRFWNYLYLCQYITEIITDTLLVYTHVHENRNPQLPNINDRIIELLLNPQYSQAITCNSLLILSVIQRDYFDPSVLLDEKLSIFSHIKQLSVDDLIFIVKARKFDFDEDLFLKNLLSIPRIRNLFTSADYIKVAYNINCKLIINNTAKIIISQVETIDQLTDSDFYLLVNRLWKDFPQLLRENKSLKNKISAERWFELAIKNIAYCNMIFSHPDIALYDFFTPPQLCHLILSFDTQTIVIEDITILRQLLLKLNDEQLREIRDFAIRHSHTSELFSKLKQLDLSDSFSPPGRNSIIKYSRSPAPFSLVIHEKPKKKIQAALAASSLLLLAGTAAGITAIFIPHILTISIALLAAALVGFAAYAAVNYSRNGFFSKRSDRDINYSDLVIQAASNKLRI